MADKSLKFVIEGEDKASSSMRSVEKSAEKMGKKVSRFGGMAKIGLAALAAGAAAAAGAAVKMAGTFEKSMSNVATLIDTGVESMDDMKKEVLDLASKTPVAINELTEALYDVRSAGIDAGGAMTVLEESAKLAVSGLGTTKEATDLVTSAINAFGIDAKEADKVSDILFKTVKSGKTTVAELARSFGATAPVISAAGFALEDFQAATAALTTTGLPASQAQNSLRQAVISLTKPTKEMSDLFSEMGVSGLPQMIEEGGTLESIMSDISKAANGNAETLTKAYGSVEAYGAAVGLADTVTEAYINTMQGMTDGSNAIDEAFKKQSETFEAQYQILSNNLSKVMIALGSAILPILNKAIMAIVPVIQIVSDWITKFSKGGVEMGDTMKMVADIAKNYLLPTIKSVFEIISSVIKTWRELWKGDFMYIQEITKFAFGAIGTIIKSTLTSIKTVFTTISSLLRGDWDGAMKAMMDGTEEMSEINKGWINATADFLSDSLLSMTQAIGGWIDGIMSAISSFGDAFSAKWNAIWTGAKTFFTGIWTSILQSLENMLNKAITIINKVISSFNKIPGISIPLISKVSLVSGGEEGAAKAGAIEAREKGGSVRSGTPYLVGEKGAELFVPNQSGSIVPNNELGGGGVNITINNPVIDRSDRIRELADEMETRFSRQMQLQRFGATI